MDYNKSSGTDSTHSIYNTETGRYLEVSSPDDTRLKTPFTLSISSLYQQPQSFTQPSKDFKNETVEYTQITTLSDLYRAVSEHDVSGAKFADGNRSQSNFIRSDVLCFDVDNDDKTNQGFFDDFGNHLTIAGFTQLFKEYEFIISTSRNHQKQKVTSYGDREPRDKYHVFLPLGASIEDRNAITEKLKQIDFYINRDNEVKKTDTAITSVSGLYGNQETKIFYNKGGSINGLFNHTPFSTDYERHTTGNRRQNSSRFTEGATDSGNSGDNSQSSWDYRNIVEKKGLSHFYNLQNRHQGDGRGYFSALCELHDDQEASLLVFNDGGFSCLGCGKKGGSALYYESLKTNKPVQEIRQIYCQELGISINTYTLLNPDDKEPFEFALTNTEDIWIDRKTYQELQKMNKKHAILSKDGKTVIMVWETTQHSNVKEIQYSGIPDYRNRYKNRRVRYSTFNGKGESVTKIGDIGSLWELWSERRQYDGLDFYPHEDRKRYEVDENIWDMWDDWDSSTSENGWKGESNKRGLNKFMDLETLNILSTDEQFEKSREGINLYLDHIHDVICGNYTGNKQDDLFNYLICWMSKLVTQHGNERVKIAPVLQGRQGCGKGTMVTPLGRIFGKHYMHILDGSRLTGQFNVQLMDKLLVFVDEAVFAGDKSIIGKLKGLLTEDTVQIEPKFINSFTSKNHMRLIYSSNEDWVVPVEWDDRRYLCIDVADKYVNNPNGKAYFDKIWHQWNKNGKEHLYKFLTSPKILGMADEINFEYDRPVTRSRVDQMLHTDEVCAWLQKVFTDGGDQGRNNLGILERVDWLNTDEINPNQDRDNVFSPDELYNDFKEFNHASGRRWNGDKHTLSKRLNDLHQQNKIWFRSVRSREDKLKRLTGKGGSTGWQFKGLDQERKLWVDEMWGGDEEGAWGGEYQPEDDVVTSTTLESNELVPPVALVEPTKTAKKQEFEFEHLIPNPEEEVDYTDYAPDDDDGLLDHFDSDL